MAETLSARVAELERKAAGIAGLERKTVRANRAAFWISLASLVVAVLAMISALPGALNETYTFLGWTQPGSSQKQLDTVHAFFRLVWSGKPDSIRSGLGYTAPGSDAELYAQLVDETVVAIESGGQKNYVSSPWKADGGDMVWCGDKAGKLCERASQFKFSSDGLIKSFSLNSTDLRELLIRPNSESTVNQSGAFIKMVGGYPYETKDGLRLCIVLKATATAPNVEIDYNRAFYDSPDLTPNGVSANGRTPLETAQATWVEINDVPLDAPWVAIPAGPAGTVSSFWFPLS